MLRKFIEFKYVKNTEGILQFDKFKDPIVINDDLIQEAKKITIFKHGYFNSEVIDAIELKMKDGKSRYVVGTIEDLVK